MPKLKLSAKELTLINSFVYVPQESSDDVKDEIKDLKNKIKKMQNIEWKLESKSLGGKKG